MNHKLLPQTRSCTHMHLPVKGSFKCTVSVCDRSTKAEVLVIKGRGMSLRGNISATELEVLKLGINIAMVTSKADSLKQKYPEVFEGVGKLKKKQISLDIDPTVKPTAQPYRRIPLIFNLRGNIRDKTTELLKKKSFECLKQKMAEACTLAYFDKNAPTKIITDTSPVRLGAVLEQEQDSAWTPVCYVSRSLTGCEQRYSQTDKCGRVRDTMSMCMR